MAQLETVYVTHNFDAENDDEIALKAGEPVIVIEKDEEFKDGWWKVSISICNIQKLLIFLCNRDVMFVVRLACFL